MASKRYPSVRPENGDSRLQANASSAEIRYRLKDYTTGLRPYDKEAGGFKPGTPASLRIQLLKGV